MKAIAQIVVAALLGLPYLASKYTYLTLLSPIQWALPRTAGTEYKTLFAVPGGSVFIRVTFFGAAPPKADAEVGDLVYSAAAPLYRNAAAVVDRELTALRETRSRSAASRGVAQLRQRAAAAQAEDAARAYEREQDAVPEYAE